jgi:hypothetical protein
MPKLSILIFFWFAINSIRKKTAVYEESKIKIIRPVEPIKHDDYRLMAITKQGKANKDNKTKRSILSNFRPLTSLTTYIIEKPCSQTQKNREKRYIQFTKNIMNKAQPVWRHCRICMRICGGVHPELLDSSFISRFLLLFLLLTMPFSV